MIPQVMVAKQPWGMYHALDQPLNFVDGYLWLFLKRCWSDHV